MVHKQFKWVYRLLRQIVFFFYWWPSEEEMKEIAAQYGYRVRIVNHFYKDRCIGLCTYRKRLLSILRTEHRVFWHELGHAVDHQARHVYVLHYPSFFPKKVGGFIGGNIIIMRSEFLATILGFQLAFHWRKQNKIS